MPIPEKLFFKPRANLLKTNKLAQGTIEYLVIIGIVIIISLVVVMMILNQTSSASQIDQQTTNLEWKSKEIEVVDFVADAVGLGTIILASNNNESVTIEGITIESSTNSYSSPLFFRSNERFNLSNLAACDEQKKLYNVTINYVTIEGLHKSVVGKFYANCVDNALVLDSIQLTADDVIESTNISTVGGFLVFTNSEAISTNGLDNLLDGTNPDGQLDISQDEVALGVTE